MEIPAVDVDELRSRLANGAALVDVREPDEWEAAHIGGSVHIPLADLPLNLDEVPTGSPVYVICARGGRSAAAVEWLRSNNVEAVNVAGGIHAWLEQGFITVSGSG